MVYPESYFVIAQKPHRIQHVWYNKLFSLYCFWCYSSSGCSRNVTKQFYILHKKKTKKHFSPGTAFSQNFQGQKTTRAKITGTLHNWSTLELSNLISPLVTSAYKYINDFSPSLVPCDGGYIWHVVCVCIYRWRVGSEFRFQDSVSGRLSGLVSRLLLGLLALAILAPLLYENCVLELS